MGYRNLLVALDLSEEAEGVARRAQEIAETFSAQLTLIHVVEPVLPAPPYELPGVMPMELEAELEKQARTRLLALAKGLGLEEKQCVVATGPTTSTIVDHALNSGVDLIVIGSHGRHGVGLLLGSTANSVLHHTKVDVLAMRVGN